MVVKAFSKFPSIDEALANAKPLEEAPKMNGNTTLPKPKEISSASTFSYQDELPRLPIPSLESTCEKYLSSLKPLQTHREHLDSQAAVQSFLKGEGHELNERLKKYEKGKTSYIEQFCK